jgi:ribosomal protein L20
MSKNWHFIKNSSRKKKFLVIARGHKGNQNKNNRVASHKALSL